MQRQPGSLVGVSPQPVSRSIAVGGNELPKGWMPVFPVIALDAWQPFPRSEPIFAPDILVDNAEDHWVGLVAGEDVAYVVEDGVLLHVGVSGAVVRLQVRPDVTAQRDRKSTRLNSSHLGISYA